MEALDRGQTVISVVNPYARWCRFPFVDQASPLVVRGMRFPFVDQASPLVVGGTLTSSVDATHPN